MGINDTFKMDLDRDWFGPEDVLTSEEGLTVIPVPEFKSFWRKLGYYITFKKYFKPLSWSYKIEINDNRSN